ncbi:SLC13 family permease [Hephaestia sp. GCM10023244]|uniref:SLC13 family permease n=1 Tax=unclassified Hephaestia TaxID=2631281 RepID=UPI002076EB1F|nr:SLC13 family permease [Hephaestia sp. MAHUQ-44]MCM8731936.1 SLC13 family permease [Hephaestia sp. MAHUQ-44]
MTIDQVAIIVLLVAMFIAYALDRFRIELVALVGLAAAFALGLVPAIALFDGFSSPAVVTVVEILLIVSVLARTRAVESFARLIVERAGGERTALAVLCAAAAFVSVFMNNIGALALIFPVALSVCTRLGIAPARMLMPLSFATLMGGMCSLTGTPANLIVNDWKVAQTGGGFDYFALGSVGVPIVVLGIGWMVLVAPRLFRRFEPDATAPLGAPAAFVTELRAAAGSGLIGLSAAAIERDHAVTLHGIVRDGRHVFARRDAMVVAPQDVLLIEAGIDALDAIDRPTGPGERIEVVVTPDSYLVGSRIGALDTLAERGVRVIGIASRRRRIEGGFGDLQIGLGDVLLLAGDREALREAIVEAGLLALMPQAPAAARPDAFLSVAVFAIGVVATALGLVPPEIAFGGVVLAMALTGSLRLRSGLQDINWTIVILLACMIPLGMAVEQTGAARVIADAIVGHLPTTEPIVVVAATLGLAALLTPFVDNVSVAAVLSPVAAGVATRSGMPIEPLLVAVAIGASLDFLTPFGHHNNAVVMGAAGYRFRDFPRLGLPLLAGSLIVALLAIRLFWI